MLARKITAAALAAIMMLCALGLAAAAAGETDTKTVTVGQLKSDAEGGGLVQLKAGYITLVVPGKAVDFDIISAAFPGVAFSGINATFTLAVEQNAAQKPVGQAARWGCTLSHGGKTVQLTDFAGYVTILYEGAYVAGATTAVRIKPGEPDFPAPTAIETGTYTMSARVRSTGTFGCTVRDVDFTDIAAHWSLGPVKNLADRMVLNDIMTEDSVEFFPDAKMSRAMFTDLFVRALGIEAKTELRFTDVSDEAWYYGTLRTAVASGIIKGVTDTSFAPEEPISREQVAIIISRVMKGMDAWKPSGAYDLSGFKDSASISEAVKAEIGPAIEAGIIKGDTLGNFRPHDFVTRAEAAVMIERFLKTEGLI